MDGSPNALNAGDLIHIAIGLADCSGVQIDMDRSAPNWPVVDKVVSFATVDNVVAGISRKHVIAIATDELVIEIRTKQGVMVVTRDELHARRSVLRIQAQPEAVHEGVDGTVIALANGHQQWIEFGDQHRAAETDPENMLAIPTDIGIVHHPTGGNIAVPGQSGNAHPRHQAIGAGQVDVADPENRCLDPVEGNAGQRVVKDGIGGATDLLVQIQIVHSTLQNSNIIRQSSEITIQNYNNMTLHCCDRGSDLHKLNDRAPAKVDQVQKSLAAHTATGKNDR